MKIEIYKTWQGYEIAKQREDNSERHDYVAGIYKGKIKWTSDYLYAKKYKSETSAKRIAEKIKNGEIK